MIEAVMFDWHGVVDRVTFSGLLKKLVKSSGKTPEEIIAAIGPSERLYAKGEMSPRQFWNGLPKLLDITWWQAEEGRRYINSLKLNGRVYERIDRIKALDNCKIAILSDCPADKAAVIRRSGAATPFDAARFSSDVFKTKDDPDFFLDFSKELGVPPDKTLFVDDQARRTQFAQPLGYQTCHYTGIASLDKSLKSLGFRFS